MIGLLLIFSFHLFIFGYHADVSLFTVTSPLLILLLFIFVVALPVIGNFSAPLTDLLTQVSLGSAIYFQACANKKACYAIKMMALPLEFLKLG